MPRVPKYVGWPLLLLWTYVVLYFLANRAVFYPLKFPDGLWSMQSRVGAADVWVQAEDGVRLHGWWIPRPEARLATLYLHGNGGNITHRIERIPEITAAGSSLLLLEYRGYGKSEGRPTEKGLYADAEAGYRHLTEAGYGPERIVIHGESLGTAVAVDLAARRRCAGVVLEAPFTSAREVAARIMPVLGPMIVSGWDSKAKIAGIRAPVLMLHGDRDEVIAFDLGRALFEAAREPKSFWAIPGAAHNNILDVAGVRYRERLAAFYESLP